MKPQRTTRRSPILRIYAAFVFAFIYLPIVVLVVYQYRAKQPLLTIRTLLTSTMPVATSGRSGVGYVG